MRVVKRLDALDHAFAAATQISDEFQSRLNEYFTDVTMGRRAVPTCRCCSGYVQEGLAIIRTLIETPPEGWPTVSTASPVVPDHLRKELSNE